MKDAEILLSKKRWNSAAFSAHQAAEKAVKALLCSVNHSPWGHASSELLYEYLMTTRRNEKQLSSTDLELLDCAKDLDRHYIPSRYPSTAMPVAPSKLYTERVASEAVSCSRRILEFAAKTLES